MLKRLTTVFGTNFALSQLGVDTQKLNPQWRRDCLDLGLKEGLNSKEIAITMLFQLPSERTSLSSATEVIHRWTAAGEVRSSVVSDARIAGTISLLRQSL